MHITLLCI